jgi:hypothetical protein
LFVYKEERMMILRSCLPRKVLLERLQRRTLESKIFLGEELIAKALSRKNLETHEQEAVAACLFEWDMIEGADFWWVEKTAQEA